MKSHLSQWDSATLASTKWQTVVCGLVMKPAVAYYRVSTEKQRRSGLGIDAQREAVRRFAAEGFELTAE
jgi:hypothetical protein